MTREGTKFRSRKIDPRKAIQVLLNSELSTLGEDTGIARSLPEVATGVDKEEEKEHHLQAAISSHAAAYTSENSKIVYIPTPDARQAVSSERYEKLYKKGYACPNSYVCFSAQVEDSIQCPYNADEVDSAWYFKNAPEGLVLLDFERLMHALETIAEDRGIASYFSFSDTLPEATDVLPSLEDVTSVLFPVQKAELLGNPGARHSTPKRSLVTDTLQTNTPGAPLDCPDSVAVLFGVDYGKISLSDLKRQRPWELVNNALYNAPPGKLIWNESSKVLAPGLKEFLPTVYKWWFSRRLTTNFKAITPSLRINEQGPKADVDAYVCFRRRDVKPQRKTRRSEMHAASHLVKIRNDLACARSLALLLLQRETLKRDLCELDRELLRKQITSVEEHRNNESLLGQPPQTRDLRLYSVYNSRLGGSSQNSGASSGGGATGGIEKALAFVRNTISSRTMRNKGSILMPPPTPGRHAAPSPHGVAAYSSAFSHSLGTSFGSSFGMASDGDRKSLSGGRTGLQRTNEGAFGALRGSGSQFSTPTNALSKKLNYTSKISKISKVGKNTSSGSSTYKRPLYVPPVIPEFPVLSQGARIQLPNFRPCTVDGYKKLLKDCGVVEDESLVPEAEVVSEDSPISDTFATTELPAALVTPSLESAFFSFDNQSRHFAISKHSNSGYGGDLLSDILAINNIENRNRTTSSSSSSSIIHNQLPLSLAENCISYAWPPPATTENEKLDYIREVRQHISEDYENDLLSQGYSKEQLLELFLNLKSQEYGSSGFDHCHMRKCLELLQSNGLDSLNESGKSGYRTASLGYHDGMAGKDSQPPPRILQNSFRQDKVFANFGIGNATHFNRTSENPRKLFADPLDYLHTSSFVGQENGENNPIQSHGVSVDLWRKQTSTFE